QIGPRADDHSINVGVSDKVFPALIGAGDAEFTRHCGRGCGPAIADGDDFDVGLPTKTGNVPQPGVGASANQADAQGLLGHDVISGCFCFFYWMVTDTPTG